MQTTIKATKKNGEILKKEIESDAKEIQMSYIDLISVDISSLRDSQALVDIWLTNNEIEKIDLSPL